MSRRKIELTGIQTMFLRDVEKRGYAIRTEPGVVEVLGKEVECEAGHFQVGGALYNVETGDAVLGFKFIEIDRANPGRFVVSKRGRDFLAKL